MELHFDSVDDFKAKFNGPNGYSFDKCSCGGIREMELSTAKVSIADCEIEIYDCPILKCKKCGAERLGNQVPQEVYTCYFKMLEAGERKCHLTALNKKRFKYAEKAGLNYDCRDLNIPGLDVDADPFHTPGFSCPVFFDRKVLNNFLTDDDYELDFFSESYGSIAKKGTDGWQWEWNIVFGINANNRVVIFLGDLDQIDIGDRVIMWLKSYNIDSDHILVDTELYRAQLGCEFSKPIIEKRILKLRDAFFQYIKSKYGISLFHLESEIEDKAKDLRKPVNYSESEIKENIILLDGLLNEGIDCDELRKLYVKFISPLPNNFRDLKTRKLLQGIIASKSDDNTAKKLMSPLFYLNDLRVCFAHLISQSEVDAIKEKIVIAYELSSFSEYRKLYNVLISGLYDLYKYLRITEF